MALVKYNNNSISSVTSAANFPAGAMTLIKEQTASSSSTISFVDGTSDVVLDSTYPIYLFKCINIHPSSDGQEFMFNLSVDSGSNYNVAKTSTAFNAQHDEGDSDTGLSYQTSQDLAQVTTAEHFSNNWGNDNDQSGVACLWLFNPSSTTYVKHYMAESHNYAHINYAWHWFNAGYGNTTNAVNAVQFKMSSGNIDSGTIKLYGIKDS
tara:strand:+ start:26 stop:649 length:624 start_codon:yes stop_codon:yes gene_type:complete